MLERAHCAGRQKPAADLRSRKTIAFKRDRIDSTPPELTNTSCTGQTTADHNDIVFIIHLSATNTSRYGKLRYTRAGTPALLAISNNSALRKARKTETGASCRNILLLLKTRARARIEKYATA